MRFNEPVVDNEPVQFKYAGTNTGFSNHFEEGGMYYNTFNKFTLEKLPVE